MKKIISVIAAIAMLAGLSSPAAFSEPEKRVTLIVEVEGDPVLAREGARTLGAKLFSDTDEAQDAHTELMAAQSRVQSEIRSDIDRHAEIGFTYTYVLNGFSVTVDSSETDSIRALPNVKNVYLSETTEIAPIIETEDDNASETMQQCAEMIGARYAHEQGYKGQGQVVAIIDSELDANHEFFAADIESPRYSKQDIAELIASNTLNVDVSANKVYRSPKLPFVYNYSSDSSDTFTPSASSIHGSHVSGIAAGKNGHLPDGSLFSGIAPEAQIVFMGVLKDGRYINTAAAVAAIEDAARLRVDAINLSIGYVYEYSGSLYGKVCTTANEAGIMVCVSSGNDSRGYKEGDIPTNIVDYSASGTPACVSSVTSAASVDSGEAWSRSGVFDADGSEVVFHDSHNITAAFESSDTLEYERCGSGTAAEFEGRQLTGKIAVVRRGQIFNDVDERARKCGAAGVIMISDDRSHIVDISTVELPFAFVGKSGGEAFSAAGTVRIAKPPAAKRLAASTGMSYFSSWGTNASLELKPDITAPGGVIYSSTIDDKYASLSGTSMSAPHLTGASALMSQALKERYKDVNTAELTEQLIMSTADILYSDEEHAIPYSPRYQGAGLLDLEGALRSPVILTDSTGKSKISLKDNLSDSFNIEFTAKNISDTDAEYDTAQICVMTDDYRTVKGKTYVDGTRPLSHTDVIPESVSVPSNESETISISVELDPAETAANSVIFPNGFFIEGYVMLSDSTDTLPSVNIPYMGFYGDWTSQEALDKPYYSGESYCGGTYLTAYSSSYGRSIRLGENPIISQMLEDESMDYSRLLKKYPRLTQEACEGEEYAGLSLNSRVLGVHAVPLRTITNASCRIYRYDTETSQITGMQLGSFSSASELIKYSDNSFSYLSMPTLDEGEYAVVLEGIFPYNDTKYTSEPMRFYIDNEYPTITSYSEKSDTLSVSASDNRFLAGFVLRASDSRGESVTLYEPVLPSNEASAHFDISGLDKSTIVVFASDYAGNMYGRTNGEINILSHELKRYMNSSSVTAELENNTNKSVTADIAAAVYNSRGALDMVSIIRNVHFDPTGDVIQAFNFNKRLDAKSRIRIMVWDSIETARPLGSAREF